ncbi:MAG TPA: hypothetical protein VF880_09580 [Actinomycetes bacterium]
MRLVRSVVLTVCLAGLVLAFAAAPAGAQSAPTLVAVGAGRHAGFDRVVFEFRGAVPATRRIRYVDQLTEDASGEPVSLAGGASLEVVFEGANAHDGRGRPTVSPRRFSPGFTALKQVAQTGDFEAVVSYGLGVDRQRPFKVSTLSGTSRLVIDIRTGGSGGTGSVDGGGALPFTGPNSRGLLVTSLALLATGATVLALARRTRTP